MVVLLESLFMGAETEVVNYEVVQVSKSQLRPPDLVSIDFSDSKLNMNSDVDVDVDVEFVPCIRSGSFEDIGHRRNMEDEHIRVDDLSSHLGSSLFPFPQRSAFYGVFDGHGGPEAAAFVKKNAMRLFFEEAKLIPETSGVEICSEELENSLCRVFQTVDRALAEDSSVNPSSGTTALATLILGRFLMVANVGDCRAVLCRKGEAVDMSQDHRPIHPSERKRVEQLGGFVDDGYLNGVLSVSRALGDWDMKLVPSPLISEPEFQHSILSEDDEFLIMGCDGVWDVMSSQHAVNVVRRGLRRHDDPQQGARELVTEALRLGTFDNLTVIVVCLSPIDHHKDTEQRRLRCCSLSAEALCSLRSLLEGGDNAR